MTVKNVEKLEKSRVALEVEVGAEEFEAAVAKAYLKARGRIRVPGFRPGKAPRKMIEKLYGAEIFYNDAVDAALPDAYAQAIESSALEVLGYPSVELVGDVTAEGFTFKATVDVYPEVKLGQYKGLSAPKEEVKVSANDVKERLNEMAERNARLVSVDRKAKKGDTAVIDFEGFDNGVPFEGGKGENYELELGSGNFVPGFEDQVIGMKAGEEKDIDITFPEDYTPELAGKPVVFHVKVSEVKFKELPELDDDFAKDVSEFDTLKELKDDIKKKIESDREQAVKVAFENALIEQVADGIEADLPESMIDAQCRRFLDEFKNRVMAQGIPYDQYAKMTGMDESKFLTDAREPAIRQVRTDLAMAEIIKAENLEAGAEEIEAEYKKLGERYGMEVEQLKKYLDEESIRTQVLNEKAVDLIVGSAKATKPEEKKTDGEPAEEEEKPAKKAAKKADKEAEDGETKPAKKTAAKKPSKKAE